MTSIDRSKPTVLILGSTGQIGQLVVKALSQTQKVQIRLCSHRQEQVEEWGGQGKEAVYLDLDEPRTFAEALAGVDRLFLLTGYTVAMLVQSKTIVDAAKKAGVQHIVHLGIFGEWDTTDPHFVWHQMIESYIKVSGIAWTNLHPNYFMENLLGMTPIKNDTFPMFCGDRRVGWVALKDVAEVAATVLSEGAKKFGGKDYWMSTESLNGKEVAEILSKVLERKIHCEYKQPDDLRELLSKSDSVEPNYAKGTVEFMRQVIDGRMGYVSSIRDDVPFVTGKPSKSLKQWAIENCDRLS